MSRDARDPLLNALRLLAPDEECQAVRDAWDEVLDAAKTGGDLRAALLRAKETAEAAGYSTEPEEQALLLLRPTP